jgi:hypothetical protein
MKILKLLLGLYVAIALVTMVLQAPHRFPGCSDAAACGLSFAKGVVWSAIWPAYWTIQGNLLK